MKTFIILILFIFTPIYLFSQDVPKNPDEDKTTIIYAPQLSITPRDVENALNFISQSYVNINFKYLSGSQNNVIQTEFFGTSKFLQGLGDINISQNGHLDYIELQSKILLLGDLRYYSISVHGTYALLNEEISSYFEDRLDNLFYGISLNTPIASLSYQNEYRTSFDKISSDINLSLLQINNRSFVSVHNSLDYIYQNKYIKSVTGLFVTTGSHAIGVELTYKDLKFANQENIVGLVYKIRL